MLFDATLWLLVSSFMQDVLSEMVAVHSYESMLLNHAWQTYSGTITYVVL